MCYLLGKVMERWICEPDHWSRLWWNVILHFQCVWRTMACDGRGSWPASDHWSGSFTVSDNTLTLSLSTAAVATVGSQTLRQPAPYAILHRLMRCSALVCVCVSREGCGRLTCPNGSKLCKNKWTPSSSSSCALLSDDAFFILTSDGPLN